MVRNRWNLEVRLIHTQPVSLITRRSCFTIRVNLEHGRLSPNTNMASRLGPEVRFTLDLSRYPGFALHTYDISSRESSRLRSIGAQY